LIGLVIAPILGNGNEGNKVALANASEMVCPVMNGVCDMNKMASMTKAECAAMCDEMGCTEADKEMCLAYYDDNGKFIEQEAAEYSTTTTQSSKDVRVEITNTNGKSTAIITTTVNGKPKIQAFEGTEADVKAKVDALK